MRKRKAKNKLGWCFYCGEFSVRIKIYTRKDKTKGRVEYCTNKGCGYKIELPMR